MVFRFRTQIETVPVCFCFDFLMHRTRSLLRADRVLQNQGEKSNRIFDLPRRGLVRMLACSRMRACHTEKAAASACFMPGLAVSNHKFSSSG